MSCWCNVGGRGGGCQWFERRQPTSWVGRRGARGRSHAIRFQVEPEAHPIPTQALVLGGLHAAARHAPANTDPRPQSLAPMQRGASPPGLPPCATPLRTLAHGPVCPAAVSSCHAIGMLVVGAGSVARHCVGICRASACVRHCTQQWPGYGNIMAAEGCARRHRV